MTPLETLVLVLGIPFFFIEISQLIQLVRSQRKLTSIWEKILEDEEYAGEVLKNFVFGFMEEISEDEESRDIFITFISSMGLNVVESIRQYYNNHVPGEVKKEAMKGVPKPLRGIIKAADAVGIDLGGILKGKLNNTAKEVAEEAVAGW